MLSPLENAVEHICESHYAFPPAHKDDLNAARARGVPGELLAFYALCDGALIGEGDDFADPNGRRYRLKIPRLADLQSTQSYGYIFDDAPLYEQSAKCWQIVDYGDSNWLAFDGSPNSGGRIIDIFHETVGEPNCHNVVANSLNDMLARLLNQGDAYWFDDDFQTLGSI